MQKTINQLISRYRVCVEHAIAGGKRCRIVADTCRNWRRGLVDDAMLAASGLHNLRGLTRLPACKQTPPAKPCPALLLSPNKVC